MSCSSGPPISKEGPAIPEAFQSVVAEATVHMSKDSIAQFMPLYYAPKSAPLQYSLQGEPWPLKTNAYTMLVTMATEAKGSISINKDPDVSPVITHDPMTPEDLKRGAAAVLEAKLLGSKLPSAESRVEHEQDWSAVYDGRGTCRMGVDPRASVVDSMLRVHGIGGLRIVDGSVLPSNTPYLAMPEVLMLAERAADLILDVATFSVSSLGKDETLKAAVTMPDAQPSSAAEMLNARLRATQPAQDWSASSTSLLAICAAAGAASALLARRLSQGFEADGDVYVQA